MANSYIEKIINFKSYDGTNLVGIYTLPNKVEHSLLMIHGLPSDKDEWGFYKDMSIYMAQHNIATFRFDFRFNGESQQGDFSNLTLSMLINDIESAYWKLQEFVDTTAISVIGTSCGGGISVAWKNRFKRDIKNLFLMAPVLDYEYEVTGKIKQNYYDSFISLDNDILKILESTQRLNDDIGYGYQMLNEAHIFDINEEFSKNNTPIYIFQGDQDTIVPFKLTQTLIVDFLKNIELIPILGADHGFAVEGDDDLTALGTKENHKLVYLGILKRI